MQWKVNSRETIYDLKNNELRITVHRISGLNGWYLSSAAYGKVLWGRKHPYFTRRMYDGAEGVDGTPT